MELVEAVKVRRSIRGFKPDPIPPDTLRELMELALRAPSWANTQPCEFAIVGGRQLEEIRAKSIEKAEQELTPDIARPQGFPEPYETRRRVSTERYMKAKGIKREDREGRGWWRLKGMRHFGSPNEIYIMIDRSFYFQGNAINVWPVFDSGLMAQTIMLLATKYGLGTIPQAQAVIYPDIIRKVLGIPDSKLIVVGIAIGYPDWDDPVNQFPSVREPLDKVARWYGVA